MSKQKTNDSPETENEVTENKVGQNELEGISSTPGVMDLEEVKESSPEIEKPAKAKLAKVTPVISTKGNSTGKMGVSRFLSLYPQDIYIATLLRHFYPKSYFTKDEWFMRIDEILDMPINN